ncbi:MAG TPA: hypothetical protein VLT33_10055, partial [Labilithrix sp.]|nr:hypothetical protein [Labilithrix sp.]
VAAVDPRRAIPGTRVLVFAGLRDPRFPHSWVAKQTEALRAAGADVESADLDADHYLILTHAEAWTTRFLAWAGRE